MTKKTISQQGKKMTKKTLLIATALTILITGVSANSEKTVFDSGIRSALKVLKYEQEHSLSEASNDIKNRYCVSLYKSDSQVIKPFDVVKMESLSLYLDYKPAYLQYDQDGESKNIFCFASGDTENEAKALLKAIRARYGKIDDFNPMIIRLDAKGEYKRAIPFLGVWAKDMTEVVGVLNAKIEKQKGELAKSKKETRDAERKLDEIKGKILSISTNDLSDFSAVSSDRDTDTKKEIVAISSAEDKAKPRVETKTKVEKKADVKVEVLVKKALPDNVKQSADCSRVFTVEN